MPYIDRDVYEALAGTKAGGRVLDGLAIGVTSGDYGPAMRAHDAHVFVRRVAKSLYTGAPNAESLSGPGRAVREDLKVRLVRIVTRGDGDQ